jgi:hypothetical protein
VESGTKRRGPGLGAGCVGAGGPACAACALPEGRPHAQRDGDALLRRGPAVGRGGSLRRSVSCFGSAGVARAGVAGPSPGSWPCPGLPAPVPSHGPEGGRNGFDSGSGSSSMGTASASGAAVGSSSGTGGGSSAVVQDSTMPRIVAVGHSLGGTSLLLYALLCSSLGVHHGVERLVLLSPAGFHRHMPSLIRLITSVAAFVLKPMGCAHVLWRCCYCCTAKPPPPSPPSLDSGTRLG